MNEVLIKIVPDEDGDDRYRYATIEVYVNGEEIACEEIGGEPEDNMWSRDYKWIAPVMSRIVEKIGANVSIEIVGEDDLDVIDM